MSQTPEPPESPTLPSDGAPPPPVDENVAPLGTTDVAGAAVDQGRARIFPCESCGADLEFHIGQQSLKCPFCGAQKVVESPEQAEIREQDFHEMIERQRRVKEKKKDTKPEPDQSEVRCESCGGTVVFSGTLTSTSCPYCGSPIQRENVHSYTERVPVDGVLPFQIDERKAHQRLADWVRSRWFAPNDFLKQGVNGNFNGVYLPYWTFDSLTFTAYTGERGENYTVTVGTGKNRRTETRTRWYPASGTFERFFDDVLVMGTKGLPVSYLKALEPWPLSRCVPFTQQYLAGWLARTYDIELEPAFTHARELIDEQINQDVRRRIGGDRQRVHSVRSRYNAVTFKHLLLPVWMLAYRYKDKPYRVFVNAATGEVQGERPYSWVKIFFTALAVLAAVLIIVAAVQS